MRVRAFLLQNPNGSFYKKSSRRLHGLNGLKRSDPINPFNPRNLWPFNLAQSVVQLPGMRRYWLLALPIPFLILLTAAVLSRVHRPSEMDYRLARGRALLDAENYLAVLETLRDLPPNAGRTAETHSYLGAAYLRLHLYQAAIKEFEEAIRLRPRQSDPWIGLASTYIDLGNAAKALDQAARATDVEQRSPHAWIALGRAHWLQRNFEEAEKAALKARELDSQSIAAGDLLLHVYFDSDQADKFQTELDRMANPSIAVQNLAVRFFIGRNQFGRAYDAKTRYGKDRLARSILETELALNREPGRMELYRELIGNLVEIGRFEEAIGFAERYRGGTPIDMELGKAYWMTSRKDQAIQAYRRASAGLVHKPSAEVALASITGDTRHWNEAFRAERVEQDYFVLAQLESILPRADSMIKAFIYRYAGIYDSASYNKAAEEALRVLDSDPQNFDALMTIGTAYHRLGRAGDAVRYIERAQEVYPNSAEPLSRLANLALSREQKDFPEIVDLMSRAVRLDPNNAGYLYNLGWIYDQTGDTKQAILYYERSIQASPLSFEAMNNLALIHGLSGSPDRALPLLEAAIRTDPGSEAGYFNLASHYFRQRDWRRAIENYERVLRMNPENAAAAIEKGRVHLELGRPEAAVETLNRALEFDAHSFEAYLLLSAGYEKMGLTREALASLDEARRIRADAPEVAAASQRLNARKDATQ
jgi:tetratricopeptide (TPR) repeat protein